MALKFLSLKGKEILPYISELANLRIEIFHEYPYLYVGDLDYEKNYLKTYVECAESMMVVVLDEDKVVGVSTAMPLEFEAVEFQQPFIEHGYNIKEVFYFGESLLKKAYRGQGIYKRFFEEREAAAKKYGSKIACFAAVERDPQDPRRPKDYAPLDKIWEQYDYKKHPELCAYYEWKEIGEEQQTAKPLVFWLKQLPPTRTTRVDPLL